MFSGVQSLIVIVLSYAAFAGAVFALVDAIRAPQSAFTAAGKQNKTLWVVLLSIATLLLFVFLPYPLGGNGGGIFGFLGLAASAAAIIYIVGVRPAIAPFRNTGGGRGPRSGGTGGW